MAAELVFAAEAELDIAEAYAWYEARRVGLGEDFLSSVDACMESIRRQPDMFPVIHEGYRRSIFAAFHMPSITSMGRRRSRFIRCFTLPATRTNGASAFHDALLAKLELRGELVGAVLVDWDALSEEA